MSQNKTKSASPSRKDKKQRKRQPFRFGVPLDRLPCTYLPDCGNVPTFLVEAGEIIRSHVDVDGLFGKSGDLSQQNDLKTRVERGEGLGGLDIHEVTSLVKIFFRLLPEPLVPCLFHDPLLSSMELATDQRTDAVQGLCFSLPAPHQSCLRYFLRLLAHIASYVDKNRMSPKNLAVVITPSLIRLKTHTKLMNQEELRVLPLQTALVEHLILHADAIGAMTSQLQQQSLKMAEELLRKKLGKKKKKKGKNPVDTEQRVWVTRAALRVVANLHFRPNTCTTVSDTFLVDGPHVKHDTSPVPSSGMSRQLETRSRSQSVSQAKRPSSQRKEVKYKKHQEKSKQKIVKPAVQLFDCESMKTPLIQSWSNAIPVFEANSETEGKSDCSGDSDWSDEIFTHIGDENIAETNSSAKSQNFSLETGSTEAKNCNTPKVESKELNSTEPGTENVEQIEPTNTKLTTVRSRRQRGGTTSKLPIRTPVRVHEGRRSTLSEPLNNLARDLLNERRATERFSGLSGDRKSSLMSKQSDMRKMPNFDQSGNEPEKSASTENDAELPDSRKNSADEVDTAKDSNHRFKFALQDLQQQESLDQLPDHFDQKRKDNLQTQQSDDTGHIFSCDTYLPEKINECSFHNCSASMDDRSEHGKTGDKYFKQQTHNRSLECVNNINNFNGACPLGTRTNDKFANRASKEIVSYHYDQWGEENEPKSIESDQRPQDNLEHFSFASNLLPTCLQQHLTLNGSQKTRVVQQTQPAGRLKRRLLLSDKSNRMGKEPLSLGEIPGDRKRVVSQMYQAQPRPDLKDNQMLQPQTINSESGGATLLLETPREAPPVQCETSKIENGFPERTPCFLTSSRSRQRRFTCSVERLPSNFYTRFPNDFPPESSRHRRLSHGMKRPFYPHLEYLKNPRTPEFNNQQRRLTCGMERLPTNHSDHFLNESFPESKRQQILSYSVDRLPSFPVQNIQDKRMLDLKNRQRRLSFGMERLSQPLLEYHQDDYSGFINRPRGLFSVAGRTPQHNYQSYQTETFSKCVPSHRLSNGFEMLSPCIIQHCRSDTVPEYMETENRNGYPVDFANTEVVKEPCSHPSRILKEKGTLQDTNACSAFSSLQDTSYQQQSAGYMSDEEIMQKGEIWREGKMKYEGMQYGQPWEIGRSEHENSELVWSSVHDQQHAYADTRLTSEAWESLPNQESGHHWKTWPGEFHDGQNRPRENVYHLENEQSYAWNQENLMGFQETSDYARERNDQDFLGEERGQFITSWNMQGPCNELYPAQQNVELHNFDNTWYQGSPKDNNAGALPHNTQYETSQDPFLSSGDGRMSHLTSLAPDTIRPASDIYQMYAPQQRDCVIARECDPYDCNGQVSQLSRQSHNTRASNYSSLHQDPLQPPQPRCNPNLNWECQFSKTRRTGSEPQILNSSFRQSMDFVARVPHGCAADRAGTLEDARNLYQVKTDAMQPVNKFEDLKEAEWMNKEEHRIVKNQDEKIAHSQPNLLVDKREQQNQKQMQFNGSKVELITLRQEPAEMENRSQNRQGEVRVENQYQQCEVTQKNQKQCFEGEGQRLRLVDANSVPLDPRFVGVKPSNRKHRRLSPGAWTRKMNTTAGKSTAREKDEIDSLQQQLEMMTIGGANKVTNQNLLEGGDVTAVAGNNPPKTGQLAEENYFSKPCSAQGPLLTISCPNQPVPDTASKPSAMSEPLNNTNSSNTCDFNSHLMFARMSACHFPVETPGFTVKLSASVPLIQSNSVSASRVPSSSASAPSSSILQSYDHPSWGSNPHTPSIDSYQTGNQSSLPEIGKDCFDVATGRSVENETLAVPRAPNSGHYLKPSSENRPLLHAEIVTRTPGDRQRVCLIPEASKKLPRRACFEPEGDIALK